MTSPLRKALLPTSQHRNELNTWESQLQISWYKNVGYGDAFSHSTSSSLEGAYLFWFGCSASQTPIMPASHFSHFQNTHAYYLGCVQVFLYLFLFLWIILKIKGCQIWQANSVSKIQPWSLTTKSQSSLGKSNSITISDQNLNGIMHTSGTRIKDCYLKSECEDKNSVFKRQGELQLRKIKELTEKQKFFFIFWKSIFSFGSSFFFMRSPPAPPSPNLHHQHIHFGWVYSTLT